MPSSSTRLKSRARRLLKALKAERRRFGGFDDSGGKRYRIGPLFMQAGALDEALDFYRAFDRWFPDDAGEPMNCFFWALALHRAGDAGGAEDRLLQTLVSNLYLLPALLGETVLREDMEHTSNWDVPEYVLSISLEFSPLLSDGERDWIRSTLASERLTRVRQAYVEAHTAVRRAKNLAERRAIIGRWHQLLDAELPRRRERSPFSEGS